MSPPSGPPSDPRAHLRCPGCHDGPFADFDHYCEANNIQSDELPMAFAAWLNGMHGWDGEAGPLEEPLGP